jgi:hypothetical protein
MNWCAGPLTERGPVMALFIALAMTATVRSDEAVVAGIGGPPSDRGEDVALRPAPGTVRLGDGIKDFLPAVDRVHLAGHLGDDFLPRFSSLLELPGPVDQVNYRGKAGVLGVCGNDI